MVAANQVFLIALGSNQPMDRGSASEVLTAALGRLADMGGQDMAISRYYQTPCFPPGAGPDYVNAAARVAYPGDAPALLEVLHRIEAEFGRQRVVRWGQRTLDLDLIAAGDAVLPDGATYAHWQGLPPDQQASCAPQELIVPHPRLQDRAFVLVPLADVAPDWVHPVLKRSVLQLLEALPMDQVKEVVAL